MREATSEMDTCLMRVYYFEKDFCNILVEKVVDVFH